MAEKHADKPKRDIFPIGLLAGGRPCLVVGGGCVGLRKVRLLLDAGARVTVISPELHPELDALVDAPKSPVTYVPREVAPADVNGFFLVFAATSDRSVNRAVLGACRQRGIYACSADSSWSTGDFVTPAIVRRDGVTVSVSTGGKSCRRSKLIRNNLDRHLEMVASADLLVIGTSHHFLSIEEREPLHLTGPRLDEAGTMLMQVWGVHDFSLVNTCNRVELHAVASDSAGVENVVRRILGFDSLPSGSFYLKRGYDAFRHVSFVTAGLLSQMFGEKHIAGQVKAALNMALENGWAGAMMQQWHDAALHVSKHIRHATDNRFRAYDIEDLVSLYLDRERAGWTARPVMVVGAGQIGRALAHRFAAGGHEVHWGYHWRAPEIPRIRRDLFRPFNLNELPGRLPEVDVVVCATGGDKPVLHGGHAPCMRTESRPLVIDLGMPRNVAGDLAASDGTIRLVNLDDLKQWQRREMADLEQVRQLGEAAVADHREMYDKLLRTFQGGNPR